MPQDEIRPWKRLSSRIVYSNPWITVEEDRVQLPNGHTTIYGIVAPKNDFVGIVPMLKPDTVVLVRQYRYIQDEVTWEIPSGSIEEHETPEEAAQRELRQEIGYQAQQFTLMNIMHSNKSIIRDKGYIFLAEGLIPSSATPDETEEFQVIPMPLTDALAMVTQYEMTDCVSIIGLLLAQIQKKDSIDSVGY